MVNQSNLEMLYDPYVDAYRKLHVTNIHLWREN